MAQSGKTKAGESEIEYRWNHLTISPYLARWHIINGESGLGIPAGVMPVLQALGLGVALRLGGNSAHSPTLNPSLRLLAPVTSGPGRPESTTGPAPTQLVKNSGHVTASMIIPVRCFTCGKV
jgi:hypothetical protein